ncbi:MAG: DUF222 domain-containing protein, partial [Actinomycetota bacterium]
MTNTPVIDDTGTEPHSAAALAAAAELVADAGAALVSAIAKLQAVDVSVLSDAVAAEWSDHVERARRIAEAAAVEVAADVDAQARFGEADGVLSTHAWLRHRHQLSGAEAHRRMQVARFLDRAPQWRKAFSDGFVPIASVEAMARAAANPRIASEALDNALDDLLADACRCGFDDFAGLVRTWERLAADDDGRDRTAALAEQRHVTLRPRIAGGWKLTGLLDDLTGAELAEVLAYFADAEWRNDHELDRDDPRRRTSAQQHADAMVAMANAAAVADPGARRANPTVNVLIDQASFEAGLTGDRVHQAAYRDVVVRTQSGHRLHPDEAINAALTG